MFGWLLQLTGYKTDNAPLDASSKDRNEKINFFKYLQNEPQEHNYNLNVILVKLVSMQTNMKELACLDVEFAISILEDRSPFKQRTFRSLLSAEHMLDIYEYYIKDPKFTAAILSERIPNVGDILLRAVYTIDLKSNKKIPRENIAYLAESIKRNPNFKLYADHTSKHSQDKDWRMQPAPETVFKAKQYNKPA